MLQGHTFTSACQSCTAFILESPDKWSINTLTMSTACCILLHVEWSRYVWIHTNHQLQAQASVQTRAQSGYSLEVTTKFRGSFHIIFHVEWAACLHSWSSSICIFAKKSVDKPRISVGLQRLLRIFLKLPRNTVVTFAIPGAGRRCSGSSLLTLALWAQA